MKSINLEITPYKMKNIEEALDCISSNLPDKKQLEELTVRLHGCALRDNDISAVI